MQQTIDKTLENHPSFSNHLDVLKDSRKGAHLHAQGIAPYLHQMFHMRGHNLWADPAKPNQVVALFSISDLFKPYQCEGKKN